MLEKDILQRISFRSAWWLAVLAAAVALWSGGSTDALGAGGPPSGLRGEFTASGVQLDWQAPASDSDSVSGYEIVRRRPWSDEAQFTTLVTDTGSAATSYLDVTATAEDELYRYRVIALRGGAKSAASESIDVSHEARSRLRPAGLTVESTADGVRLRWLAPEAVAERVRGYVIQRNPTATGRGAMRHYHTLSDASVTYLDTGAIGPGQRYTYRVRAIRGLEKSLPSRTASVTVPGEPTAADLAPSSLTLESSTLGVVLRWSAPAVSADTVTLYDVYRSPTQAGRAQIGRLLWVPPHNIAYTDTTAAREGVEFTYEVRARRGTDVSESSGPVSIVYEAPQPDPSRALSNLRAEELADGIRLFWDAPVRDPAAVNGYRVERTLVNGKKRLLISFGGRMRQWTDKVSEKRPGETYRYRISASRGGVMSDWSEPVEIGWRVPLSTDASLSALELRDSGGTAIELTPEFAPDVTEYSASVPNGVETVTLTAQKSSTGASVTVLPRSGASDPNEATVDLSVGSNELGVVVTAEDGNATVTYTISIERAEPESPANTPPVILSIAITGDTGNHGTYGIDDDVKVTVTFSADVAVTGAPQMELDIGGVAKTAEYESARGSQAVFGYTVAEGDSDTDGIAIGANELILNGGSISDAAGSDADVSHAALLPQQAHRVDGIRPMTAANGGLAVDRTMLKLTYDETLDGDSQPALGDFTVVAAGEPRKVNAVTVSDNVVSLKLDSTVKDGQIVALDYTPGNHPIRDLAGNLATALTDEPVTNQTLTNVLLITVDDMNWDSVGAFGSPVEGTTPNIDQLAAEGMRFFNAHVTVANCTPSRMALATGRYPHLSGGEGFHDLTVRGVPFLARILRNQGYDVGVLGKVDGSTPYAAFQWDLAPDVNLKQPRNPELYYQHAQDFMQEAADAGRPFFLMANLDDPHRPFHGPNKHSPSRVFAPEEVVVPGFLPDIPKVRQEIAVYYSAVRRADDTVGRLLDALDDTGMGESTLVMFLSDHGMAFPFAKTNVWRNSTRTPWVVRWPGVVEGGQVDTEHFISAIDYMPTVLDALGMDIPAGVNGRSYLPVLQGDDQDGRDLVFTQFHETSARREYPMRSVQNARFGYIFNAWSNGRLVFKSDSLKSKAWKAMQEARSDDPEVAARVHFYTYRVPEEFYDYENDPNALNNLIDDPDYADEVQDLREKLEDWMESTSDPLYDTFRLFIADSGNSQATGKSRHQGVRPIGLGDDGRYVSHR